MAAQEANRFSLADERQTVTFVLRGWEFPERPQEGTGGFVVFGIEASGEASWTVAEFTGAYSDDLLHMWRMLRAWAEVPITTDGAIGSMEPGLVVEARPATGGAVQVDVQVDGNRASVTVNSDDLGQMAAWLKAEFSRLIPEERFVPAPAPSRFLGIVVAPIVMWSLAVFIAVGRGFIWVFGGRPRRTSASSRRP